MTHVLRRRRALPVVAVVAAILLLLVIGGYGLGWRWTGLSSRVTLWNWLEALALPVAVASAPVLLRRRHGLTGRHRSVLGATLICFAGFVAISYAVPLGWTGFSGNTMWDWLKLLLLPVAVATASLWPQARAVPRLRTGALIGLVLFGTVVACGYLVPWRWTGFSGNTMWDWTSLLLVPLLIPTVLVPAVIGRLDVRLARGEQ